MLDSLMALVPMKPFAESKARLADVLDDAARIELSRRLFQRTLRVLRRVRGIARVAVISRDAEVLKIARRRGAWGIWEARAGLNQALEQATRVAVANGARAVLIVPADLPQLAPRAVEKILALGDNPPCIVIASAQRDGGTNALLVNPAGLIEYAFGENSAREHWRRAENASARVALYESDTVTFDLDLPEDLPMIQSKIKNPKS